MELAPAAVPVQMIRTAVDADVSDAEALERMDLAEPGSPRYALARPLPGSIGSELPQLEAESVLRRLADGQAGAADAAVAGPAIAAALDWGRRAGAVDAVVGLARSVDGTLLHAARTGAWGIVITAGLDAARESGRRLDEAYFLHQQGTRWLCIGQGDLADRTLREALGLRERLGDDAGVAATRHNLDVLHGVGAGSAGNGAGERAAASRGRRGSPRPADSMRRWLIGGLGTVVAAGAGLAVGLALGGGGGSTQTTVVQGGRTVTETTTTIVRQGTSTAQTSTVTQSVTTTVTGPGNTVTQSPTTVTVSVSGPTVTTSITVPTTVTTTITLSPSSIG